MLIPGITDKEDQLMALGKFLSSLGTPPKIEILPYHKLGLAKYENLGIPYSLKNTPAASEADARAALSVIEKAMKDHK